MNDNDNLEQIVEIFGVTFWCNDKWIKNEMDVYLEIYSPYGRFT